MTAPFFEAPVLNSPYEYPERHWELDPDRQPTNRVLSQRRPAAYITPVPQPRKRRGQARQQPMVLDEGAGLSTEDQQYEGLEGLMDDSYETVVQHLRPWVEPPPRLGPSAEPTADPPPGEKRSAGASTI